MRERALNAYGFLRTTLIGGVIFLLPLMVVGALLGQLVQIVYAVADGIADFLPFQTAFGYSLLVAAAFGVVLGSCFFAGIVARHRIGQWLSNQAERNLTLLYPRYAVYKDQLIGNVGGGVAEGRLRPVRITLVDCVRLGLEVERDPDGLVTVYLPSSPDPWSGTVALVEPSRVERLDVPYVELMTTYEKLGTDSLRLSKRTVQSAPVTPTERDILHPRFGNESV